MNAKLLLINLFAFIAFSLYGQRENYEYFPLFLPKNDIEYLQKGKLLNDSVYFTEKRIEGIITTELDSMPKSIVDIFIGRSPLEANFYYLGYIPVNLNFETYIFMIDYYNWFHWLQCYKCYISSIERYYKLWRNVYFLPLFH